MLAARLFLAAWIVSRIDVIEFRRRLTMNLNYRLARGHSVVVHAGLEVRETAGWEAHHFTGFKLIAHADSQRPREDSHVLPVGVRMRRDLVAVRHLEANCETARGSHRVAL